MILFTVAVSECRQELLAAGFKELNESDHWDLKPCDKVWTNEHLGKSLLYIDCSKVFRAISL